MFLSGLFGCSSNADWNSAFVVWNGDMYEISNEYVEEADEEIGKVTKYSDREGTYSGNFSNKYRKGTRLYSIKDIKTDDAIAIEEDGKYRKAINNGTYGEKVIISNPDSINVKSGSVKTSMKT